MNQKYRRIKTTVSSINYHFVFCPRYRRKIFLDKKVEGRFKDIVYEVCEQLKIKIITIECGKDYTHMFLNSVPKLSPSEIMAKIKGVSSRKLREEFEKLSHLPSLWTRSFFVSTEEKVSRDTIREYIDEQKTRG